MAYIFKLHVPIVTIYQNYILEQNWTFSSNKIKRVWKRRVKVFLVNIVENITRRPRKGVSNRLMPDVACAQSTLFLFIAWSFPACMHSHYTVYLAPIVYPTFQSAENAAGAGRGSTIENMQIIREIFVRYVETWHRPPPHFPFALLTHKIFGRW